MSIVLEVLRALLSETEASNGGSSPKGPSIPVASYPRARGTSRLQKSPPPAPIASTLTLPEESPITLLPAPPIAGIRRPSPVSINLTQAQQGVVWAEVLGKPRAMKPWSPRA